MPVSFGSRIKLDLQVNWEAACPHCRADCGLLQKASGSLQCPQCTTAYPQIDGIWRLLAPGRAEHFEPFLRDYTSIRLAEGRGSDSADFYRRLPDCPANHPLAWQWNIHRRTFDCLCRRVLPRLGSGLKILDLGAGVGWLSHRLAELGHHPCAIDLSLDDQDGLGAARHYSPCWPRMQAEFDRLPFSAASLDGVLFNSSLHYSTDYRVTLGEALRVLRPSGWLMVLETPIYRRSESGRQMVDQRRAEFERRYGTASDALPSQEFLTWRMLEKLAEQMGIGWKVMRPWYGWKWALRPWKARLKRKREPARFVILIANRR